MMNDPLYRLQFDAAELMRHHPPQLRHPNKATLLDIAYPPGTSHAGTVDVTRWAAMLTEPLS